MTTRPTLLPCRRRALLAAPLAALMALAAGSANSHDFRVGDIVIDHPYAVPMVPGARTGAVYLRTLRNTGTQPDQLLGASTPAAGSVEVHRMSMEGDVMRMRPVDALPLPPGSALPMRQGGEYHLMLLQPTSTLKVGDSFPLTLRFARAGSKTVTVTVQQPRDDAGAAKHQH